LQLVQTIMALGIVWPNPVPPAKTECWVEAITVDELAHRMPRAVDKMVAFEVMLAARPESGLSPTANKC
jgi:hypothetical protein